MMRGSVFATLYVLHEPVLMDDSLFDEENDLPSMWGIHRGYLKHWER